MAIAVSLPERKTEHEMAPFDRRTGSIGISLTRPLQALQAGACGCASKGHLQNVAALWSMPSFETKQQRMPKLDDKPMPRRLSSMSCGRKLGMSQRIHPNVIPEANRRRHRYAGAVPNVRFRSHNLPGRHRRPRPGSIGGGGHGVLQRLTER